MAFKTYNHLNVPDQWNNYFSKYPNGYTILEALISWVGQVDDMSDTWNNFIASFDADLQADVLATLTAWQNDGTLNTIINQDIFGDINNQLKFVFYNVEKESRLSGETDDTGKIQRALNNAKSLGYKVVEITESYTVSTNISIPSGLTLQGGGTITSTSTTADIFDIYGAGVLGTESSGITIKNLNLVGGFFGVQVYGDGYQYKPHDILIEDVSTTGTQAGGVFLSSCYNVTVRRLINSGGYRAVGTKAPISSPADTYNILIEGCFSKGTTQFCYQTYYGEHITIKNNFADGSSLTSQDKSCITIDRSKYVNVEGNNLKNAPTDQIFVTGSFSVNVTGNNCYGGQYGIQVSFNWESGEDAAIHEAQFITILGNNVREYTSNGIIINGVKDVTITGNTGNSSVGTNFLYIMEGIRTTDSVQMYTQKCTVSSNVSEQPIQRQPTVEAINFIGNNVSVINGVDPTKDIVFDKTTFTLANKQLSEVGIFKRTNAPDSFWLSEYDLATASVHKGMRITYDYGGYTLRDSTGTAIFGFSVGANGNVGDMTVYTAGRGIILTTPDGLSKYKLTISNTGTIVTTKQ